MQRWSGKVAVVTGAGSGNGHAIASELVKHGMKVVALDFRKESLDVLADELKENQGFIRTFKCDVRSREDIKSAFEFTHKNLGPVSVLVNNAGVLVNAPLHEFNQDGALKVMETNVIGVINCTMEATNSMKRHNIDGHIINISSVCGKNTMPIKGFGAYIGSKHAVSALTECLRNDLGHDKSQIRVTSICPGLVETEMAKAIFEKDPNLPIIHSKDVADCVIFALQMPKHVNISEITVQGVGEMYEKWNC